MDRPDVRALARERIVVHVLTATDGNKSMEPPKNTRSKQRGELATNDYHLKPLFSEVLIASIEGRVPF